MIDLLQGCRERVDPLQAPLSVVLHYLKNLELACGNLHDPIIEVSGGVGYGTHPVAPSIEKSVGVGSSEEASRSVGNPHRDERRLGAPRSGRVQRTWPAAAWLPEGSAPRRYCSRC